ncbi:uncharacterized protein CBL_09472 [Carabus blaptoides fortunei]
MHLILHSTALFSNKRRFQYFLGGRCSIAQDNIVQKDNNLIQESCNIVFYFSIMSSTLVHITEDRVRKLLDWEATLAAVETSLVAVSQNRAIQNPRSFTNVLGTKDLLLCMPGYVQNGTNGTLACKMVTVCANNEKLDPPLPSILANIFLFNEKSGQLKGIIEATEITAWRTAAASVAATKCLHFGHAERKSNIVAILGAGTQGRIHAIAFQHFFNFKMIHIWNHRFEKAKLLVEELMSLGIPARVFETSKECVTDADVIVTATFTPNPIVHLAWIKPNVHINAVGAGANHHSELDEALYHNSVIYVDHMAGAKVELAGLEKMGVQLVGEIGELISNDKPLPQNDKITIFHSLGMAAEDAAVGQIIYDRFMKELIE